MEYQPGWILTLTCGRYPAWGQCQVGSLTGAVASMWGALAVTPRANSAVCWKLRPLPDSLLRESGKGCSIRRYPQG